MPTDLRRWLDAVTTLVETADDGAHVVRTVPTAEAVEMLHAAYYGGKNKEMGLTPTRFHRESEDFVLVDLPLCMIRPNEEGERYDATTNLDRARAYAKQQISTPIFVTYSSHAMRMGSRLGYVSDGGHRVSAARMRGATHIRALMRQSDFDRLVAADQAPRLAEAAGLTEKVYMASIHNGRRELPVYENPSPTQVRNLLAATEWQEARMVFDEDDNLFMWDAGLAHHSQIAMALGITERYVGFIDKRGITLRVHPERLPAICRALQRAPAVIHALGADVPVNIR